MLVNSEILDYFSIATFLNLRATQDTKSNEGQTVLFLNLFKVRFQILQK